MASDSLTFEKGTIAGVVMGGKREAMSLGLERHRQRAIVEIPFIKPADERHGTERGVPEKQDVREHLLPRLWWLPPSAVLGSLVWFQIINALLSSAIIFSILH